LKWGIILRKEKITKVQRIFYLTQQLLSNPGKILSLKHFVDKLGAAKSTISEDLTEIKNNFRAIGEGTLQTVSGKSGGVKFIPKQNKNQIDQTLKDLHTRLTSPRRILPGGYLYMSDIVTDPELIKKVAKIFAGYFYDQKPDLVLTVETKGILLAGFTADYLGLPLAVARRNSRVTEGSVITINYISGSSNKIQNMSLSTRAIEKNSRILIIDDFMKGGGTLNGLSTLVSEFESKVVGMGVLLEQGYGKEKLVSNYLPLGFLNTIDINKDYVDINMNRTEIFLR